MKLKKENSMKTKIERIINKRQALIITSLVVLALAIGFWSNGVQIASGGQLETINASRIVNASADKVWDIVSQVDN
jgi:hypothetical protein